MGVEPGKDSVFQNPVSVPKDWCPENKNLKELISLRKSYQSHNETIPTARATHILDIDDDHLSFPFSSLGDYQVKRIMVWHWVALKMVWRKSSLCEYIFKCSKFKICQNFQKNKKEDEILA